MFAVGAEDGAGLAIVSGLLVEFGAEADGAGILVEAEAEVVYFSGGPFEFGEDSGHGLCVVPDVSAGSLAATDAFPGPEASVAEAVNGGGGEGGGVGEGAVEEPVGQSGIVPGVFPEFGLGGEGFEVFAEVADGVESGVEAGGVVSGGGGFDAVYFEVGEVPGDGEGDGFFSARDERERSGQRALGTIVERLRGRIVSGICH